MLCFSFLQSSFSQSQYRGSVVFVWLAPAQLLPAPTNIEFWVLQRRNTENSEWAIQPQPLPWAIQPQKYEHHTLLPVLETRSPRAHHFPHLVLHLQEDLGLHLQTKTEVAVPFLLEQCRLSSLTYLLHTSTDTAASWFLGRCFFSWTFSIASHVSWLWSFCSSWLWWCCSSLRGGLSWGFSSFGRGSSGLSSLARGSSGFSSLGRGAVGSPALQWALQPWQERLLQQEEWPLELSQELPPPCAAAGCPALGRLSMLSSTNSQ